MRKMRAWIAIPVLVLALVLVACGNSTSSTDSSVDSAGATEDSSSVAIGKDKPSLNSSGGDADISALPTLNAKLPTGSLVQLRQVDEPVQLSEAETERVDRAIRAYTPPADDSLLINKAKSFYYYDQLKGDAKSTYEALAQLYNDPTNDDVFFMVELKKNEDPKEFENQVMLAYLAIQYDHPEFFWSYNGLETDIVVGQPHGSTNSYVFYLEKPYKRYKKEMKAFNKATEEFLADIDPSQSDSQIAQAIHDKLIKTVTYDYDVAEGEENDLAHTAYGALVKNSSGDEHHAVCDGYAQAFVYLLQQMGINAAVAVGNAGTDDANMGGHAWAVVELDGDWYEVDSTWDDQEDQWLEAIAEVKEADPENAALPYYEKAFNDEQYVNRIEHYLYNVTTDSITNYQPSEDLLYTFDDGNQLQIIKPSFHRRFTEDEDASFGALMKLAPEATGTKYAFDAS